MQFQMICMICLSLLKVGKSSDKYNNVVYKNSELGQPLKITTFTNMPSNITLDDVDSEKAFANVELVWICKLPRYQAYSNWQSRLL